VIAIPALALPFLIRGAVVGGIATATEVSTIGIVYSVLAGLLIYRKFDVGRLLPMLVQTASLTGAILLIVGAAPPWPGRSPVPASPAWSPAGLQ
jgi:TRAP-type C4-dicarboxylate transport system permease large subunit